LLAINSHTSFRRVSSPPGTTGYTTSRIDSSGRASAAQTICRKMLPSNDQNLWMCFGKGEPSRMMI
jgi:hypothetical protein